MEGEELNPEQESLEVDSARLQHKSIDMSRSALGMVFTGEGPGDPENTDPLLGEKCVLWDFTLNPAVRTHQRWVPGLGIPCPRPELPMFLVEAAQQSAHLHPAGVDTMASYEEVLHLLRYRNWHTRSLLDRKFKLICSELNGRYMSNEFQVEVSAVPQGSRNANVVNICSRLGLAWCPWSGLMGRVGWPAPGGSARSCLQGRQD